jgi:nicotinamide riboside transporter PnuC
MMRDQVMVVVEVMAEFATSVVEQWLRLVALQVMGVDLHCLHYHYDSVMVVEVDSVRMVR